LSAGRPGRTVALVLAAILLAGLGLRLARWAEERGHPLGLAPTGDERTYDAWARAIAAGEAEAEVPYQAPLHAYAGAAFHAPLEPAAARDAWRLLGALLGVGSAGLAFLCGRRVCPRDPRVGLAAAGLVALHLPLVYYETTLLRDGPATFATALAAWLLLRLLEPGLPDGRRRGRAALLGVVLGLGALWRENLLLVGGAVVAGLAVWAWRRGPPRRPALAAVAAVALAFAGPLAPWVAGNYRLEGRLSPFPTWNGGCVFYLANRRGNPSPGYMPPDFVAVANPEGEVAGFRSEAEARLGRSLTPHEVSSYWLRQGLAEVAADPLRYAWKVLRRATLLLATREYVHARDPVLDAGDSAVLRLPLPGFGVLAGLGLVGLAAARRRREALALALLALAVAGTTVPVAFATRYRLPVVPLVAVLAALGAREAAAGLRRARGGARLRAAAPLLVGVAATIACTAIPVPYAHGQRVNGIRTRILAFMTLGRRDEAFAEVERLATPRDRAGAWTELGERILANEDDPALAEAALREALAEDAAPPGLRAVTWSVLCRVAVARGDLDAAEAAAERARALDPGRPLYAQQVAAVRALRERR